MRLQPGVDSLSLRTLSFLFPIYLCVASAGADSVVVFNEIQYHPPGNEAQLEWIELHNQMAVDVDISGWYLGDGVSFAFEPGTIINGGGYLVVAASPAALEAGTGFSQALGPFEGRLDNNGETLELIDRNGRLLDSVRYRDGDDWPAGADGSGATLAKRHPDLASRPAANWTHSAQIGGTPGARNFIDPDAPTGLPRDILSYWSLDEAGGSFSDLAGGNNGSPGSGAARVAGLVGAGAVSFNNGSSAYINVGAGAGTSYSLTTGITIEALIQPTWSAALGDQDQILRKEDGESRLLLALQNDGNAGGTSLPPVGPGPVLAFGLNIGGAYTELDMLLDGQEGRPALATLLDGNPHHVAATYDSASGRKALYFDGALAFSVQLAAGSLISSGGGSTAYIGNMTGRAEPFTGIIDEVAIWKRALGAADVAHHASQAAAGKSYFEVDPGPGPSAGPQLAFNEVSAPDGQAAFIEIANLGDAAVELRDHVIQRLGPSSSEIVLGAGAVAAHGYLAWTSAQLGFMPVAGDTVFLWTPDRAMVLAAVQIGTGLVGRFPDGGGRWLLPSQPTPGAANVFDLRDEIVINEIMYHHRGDTSGGAFVASHEAWIELYNRSGAAVPLTGWRLAGGIGYAFPDGTTLAAGEYLVVAQDAAALRAKYAGIRVLGDLTGQLSNESDAVRLEDAAGNPADEVRYHDGGRWPEYADGGGSSLELRDPRADNGVAEAWAASDEAAKSTWKSYSYRTVAAAGVGPTQWREFVLGLLDAGEALVDDIHVVETPATAPKELLQNSTFDTGVAKWRLLGNHGTSSAATDDTGQVLHLVASGPTEHMHNHLETTFGGGASVANGREYEISFRARWLGGSNRLHTRLYFNRAPRTTLLDVPPLNGTPGARNSRFEDNIGPTFAELGHSPVAPAPTEPVTVSLVASDPDGIAGLDLWTSVNGAAFASTPMTAKGGGRYEGTIPAQVAGALVHFYVEGTDARGAKSTAPAAGPGSRALYRVKDGAAVLGRVHNVRILMTTADTNLIHLNTNVMSNRRMGATIVYDEREAFYDAGVRLKGSERGRNVSARVGFNIRLDPEHKLRGVHERFDVDRSGGWIFGGPFGQDEIVIKHMVQRAGGIPGMYDDLIRVIAPRPAQTGSAMLIMAAFGDVYLESQYPDGGDGNTFEMELIYYPTSTVGGIEGLKLPEPDNVQGSDFTNLGNDKEPYRWTFLIDSHRDEDDYSRLVALCKAFATAGGGLEAAARSVIDVDEWMRAFAMQSLCGVTDAYTRGNNHNFVVYFPPHEAPALAFLWDQDFAYVQPANAPLSGDQNLGRIIQLPANRRLYYGHLLDLMNETVNTQYMGRWTAHYGNLAGQSYANVLNYLGQRATFVRQQIPARVPFAITTQNGEDFTVDALDVVLDGNGWFDVRSILVAGQDDVAEVQWTALTKWRTTVPLRPGPNALQLLAFDWRGNVVGTDAITVVSTSEPPTASFIRGDVNLSRTIDIGDAIKILLHLFLGGAIDCQDAADLTNDEKLDLTDPIYLLEYLFRRGAAPEAPFPTAGLDTGAGGQLGCELGL